MHFSRLSLILTALLAALPLRAEPAGTLSFLRTSDLPGGARGVQTSSVQYRPEGGGGPTVWLIGVAHLGTPEYFQAIQQRLDAQTVVLYEGVGLRDVKDGPGAPRGDASIQASLANALGLKFQLDAIDYRRPSFVNSDLRVPELQQEVKKRGGGASENENVDQLVQAFQGTGPLGGALTQMISLLGATPQMRETTRLLLVEMLGQSGELLSIAQQASAEMRELFDVLLRQRNAIVMRDLEAQLARRKSGESIAVFYGAAHMDEIARRLREELHYQPVKTEWDTAFSASAAASGINPAQMRMMIQMLRSQLQPAIPR